MPLRRQANRLFPNAAEGPAGAVLPLTSQKRQGKALRDTREQASPPFGKALPSTALPLHARFLVERGAMAGGEILIGKHMLLRALMLDAVAVSYTHLQRREQVLRRDVPHPPESLHRRSPYP